MKKAEYEAAKEAWRIKKIKDDQEEEERKRKLRLAFEEKVRVLKERIEYERVE